MGSHDSKAIAPILVPVQQRVIEWDAAGLPSVTTQPVLTKQNIQSLYYILAARPYVVDDPQDPDFGKYDGMSCVEVLVRKQLHRAAQFGEPEDIERIMNRMLGNPKQVTESLRVNASYEDVLKGIEAKMKMAPIDVGEEADVSMDLFGDLAS